jgi:hypothetical protein
MRNSPRTQVHVGPSSWDGTLTACVPNPDAVREMKPPAALWTSSATPAVSDWAARVLVKDPDLAPSHAAVFAFEPIGTPRVLVLRTNSDIGNAWIGMQGRFIDRWITVGKTLDNLDMEKFWELAEKNYDAVHVPADYDRNSVLKSWENESTAWFHPERNLRLLSITPQSAGEVELPNRTYIATEDMTDGDRRDARFRASWDARVREGAVFREVVPPIGSLDGAGIVACFREAGPDYGLALSSADAEAEKARMRENGLPYSVMKRASDGTEVLMRYVAGKLDGKEPGLEAVLQLPSDDLKPMTATPMCQGARVGPPYDPMNSPTLDEAMILR